MLDGACLGVAIGRKTSIPFTYSLKVIVYDSKHYEAGVASMGFDDKGQPNAKYAWGADMMQCLQNKSDEGKHEGAWEKKEFS